MASFMYRRLPNHRNLQSVQSFEKDNILYLQFTIKVNYTAAGLLLECLRKEQDTVERGKSGCRKSGFNKLYSIL